MKLLSELDGFLIIAIIGNFSLTPTAFGKRSITVPPIHIHSVHGGRMGKACNSADEVGYTDWIMGVKQAMHVIDILFTNLSNRAQTVTFVVLRGTSIFGHHSRGSATHTPDTPVPGAITLAFEKAWTKMLPGNGSMNMKLRTYCNSANCGIEIDGILVTGSGWLANRDAGQEQVCLKLKSQIFSRIELAEAVGAIVANITTTGHRFYGTIDKDLAGGSSNILINAGRPF